MSEEVNRLEGLLARAKPPKYEIARQPKRKAINGASKKRPKREPLEARTVGGGARKGGRDGRGKPRGR